MSTTVTPGAAALLDLLVVHPALSRAELSRLSGLTQGAVTKALRPLLEAGYVRETADVATPTERRSVGRPSIPVALQADRETVVGVKLTDRSVVAVLTDLRATVRHDVELALPSGEVDATVETIAEAVRRLRPHGWADMHRLGLAVSGDIDRSHGRVRHSPFLGWTNIDLAALVEDAAGLVVTLENDVKALACKEHLTGAGAGLRSFAMVTIGTGVGCSLVVDGSLVAGAFGVAGEIGHIVVDRDGPACHCGSRGCLEAIASTAAIERELASATGIPGITVEQGARLAADGIPDAQACFVTAGDALGLGLAAVANLVGPQRIVVSGEGLDNGDLVREAATRRFHQQTFGAAGRCELLFRPLPVQQWAAGAAAVAVQDVFRPPERRRIHEAHTIRRRHGRRGLARGGGSVVGTPGWHG